MILQDFKARAEFFSAGRIIPRRIIKGPRRLATYLRFGGNAWALRTPRGYIVYIEPHDDDENYSGVRFVPPKRGPDSYGYAKCRPRGKRAKHVHFVGAPYSGPGKELMLLGHKTTKDQLLEALRGHGALGGST